MEMERDVGFRVRSGDWDGERSFVGERERSRDTAGVEREDFRDGDFRRGGK